MQLAREDNALRVGVNASRTTGDTEPALVWLALYQDGLTSQVSAGENKGLTLHHDRVVRALAGPWRMDAKPLADEVRVQVAGAGRCRKDGSGAVRRIRQDRRRAAGIVVAALGLSAGAVSKLRDARIAAPACRGTGIQRLPRNPSARRAPSAQGIPTSTMCPAMCERFSQRHAGRWWLAPAFDSGTTT